MTASGATAPRSTPRVLPPLPLALAGVLAFAVAASAAPLLTYSLSLATLGGAHVLAELRFVEARYAARLGHRLAAGLGALLLVVVLLRLLKALDLWSGTPAVRAELVVVAALGALVLPRLWSAGRRPALVGLAVVVGLGVGLVARPVLTILLLACLHNWTPVGFLAEGLPRAERRAGLVLGLLAFVVGPLAVLVAGLLLPSLPALPALTLLPTGSLARQLGAYLPSTVHDATWAVPAFSALVYAQCMHYAAVIGVLPRLAPGGPQAAAVVGLSRVPRPTWLVAVAGLSLVGLAGYAVDFHETRAWYGLAAAVHAWVEVPVLLLALLPAGRMTASRVEPLQVPPTAPSAQ